MSVPREPSSAGLSDVGTCRQCSGVDASWISGTLFAMKGLNLLLSLVTYGRTVMESVQKVALLIGRSNSSIIIKWRRVEITATWSSKRGTDNCFKDVLHVFPMTNVQ